MELETVNFKMWEPIGHEKAPIFHMHLWGRSDADHHLSVNMGVEYHSVFFSVALVYLIHFSFALSIQLACQETLSM